MTNAASDPQIVPREPASLPVLRAADQGVADALESVLSDNTRRVYGAQWRIFTGWCDEVGLQSMPAEPLTVARYLAARAGDGASIATLRLTASAIAKAHEWAGHESPCRDQGVRASLKGWGRRLARPQRQAGALTADVLAVIRLTAVQPRKRGRGFETAEQTAERVRFDMALVASLSDGGLRRSEASALAWGDVQRWDDGSGWHHRGPLQDRRGGRWRRGGHHPAAMRALDLPRRLRKLDNFGFLLLDDLGYLPQGTEESEVLFTLIAERYERRSLGITSNLVFSEWERIFANPMATAAAIDWVVHHSLILEFDVPSYRTDAQQRGQAEEVNQQN